MSPVVSLAGKLSSGIGGERRVGDFGTRDDLGLSGMNAATSCAMITKMAPNANGGPGMKFCEISK